MLVFRFESVLAVFVVLSHSAANPDGGQLNKEIK